MSFAADVKAELCRAKLGKKCCTQAEACGVLLYCNRFSLREVKIVTESPAFAQRLPGLFHRAFGLSFDEKGDPDAPGKRIFRITAPDKVAVLWEQCAFDPAGPAHHINFGALEEEHCRLAFLRGAFLAGGSVTDPQKGYHLELATTHLRVSRELNTLLLELGYAPKETTRKANYITYFKQSEAIEDFLTAIGAPLAAMGVMNAKAEKAVVGGVNRRGPHRGHDADEHESREIPAQRREPPRQLRGRQRRQDRRRSPGAAPGHPDPPEERRFGRADP